MSLSWISYTLCKYMQLTVGRDAGALLVVGQFITILKSQITTSNQAAAGSPPLQWSHTTQYQYNITQVHENQFSFI